MQSVPTWLRIGFCIVGFLLLAACGTGVQGQPTFEAPAPPVVPPVEPPPSDPPTLTVQFHPGPMAYAVEAELALPGLDQVERASFTVKTRPGGRSEPIHVSFGRSWLDRAGALDVQAGTLRMPVFGLYAGYANAVLIEVVLADGTVADGSYTVPTEPAVLDGPPTEINVEHVDPSLDVSFFSVQGFGPPRIIDIDGEIRWTCPEPGDFVFPRIQTRDGFVMGSASTNGIYHYDWLGRMERFAMSDPRLTKSHHNFAPGKTGILNTVAVKELDTGLLRSLSVLVEITETGDTIREWNFDQIFMDRITAAGEDPAPFVTLGQNWFHMNAAIYCPADDSVIASSRENFVVKADHATGEIKWLLGNPGKRWFTDYPKSLQPLALEVVGDPPIGQHALSISADGQYLMLFNNGMGNMALPNVGDDRTYSKVSVYHIDDVARRAEEVWSFDHGKALFSPICSSAYQTSVGNVIVAFSSPQDVEPILEVVNTAGDTLFRATVTGPGCGSLYAVEEILLQELTLE